jgi:hypothetical protein
MLGFELQMLGFGRKKNVVPAKPHICNGGEPKPHMQGLLYL